MIAFISIVVLLVVLTVLYMQRPLFGKSPTGHRLERMQQSSNFKKGKFQNLVHTPDLAEGYSTMGVMFDFFFKNPPRRKPKDRIPYQNTDLKNLSSDQNVLIWFGHSSYFIQLDGVRILIDPVFSGNASPIPGTTKSFPGTDAYTVADLPDIDYLFISHDHYDHLDHKTILELRPKTGKVICGLGVGAHFEAWGYDVGDILERDWYESLPLSDGFTATVTPARHFSGRGLTRNTTLWCSYLLNAPSGKIYMGGDSGYGGHFADIGEKFGPIDLVILDNGQYDKAWRYIHTLPDEVLQAAKDLKAKRLFPVHNSKFVLGNHPWDEPLDTISKLNEQNFTLPLVTPIIGEVVDLDNTDQQFSQWWKGLD